MKIHRIAKLIILAATPMLGAWSLSSIPLMPPELGAAPELLPLAQAEPDAQPLEVDAIVAGLQARYDGITDYSADFVQENTQVALGTTRTSGGQVYFMRPGMMRWDYADPERHLIIDGETLWSVEPTRLQYYTAPLDSTELPSELRFLMGQGRLADDFEITLLDESTSELAILDLVPRETGASYSRLLFVVTVDGFEVVETTIVDALGNTNTIRFIDPQYNAGFSPEAFRFEPDDTMTRIQPPE